METVNLIKITDSDLADLTFDAFQNNAFVRLDQVKVVPKRLTLEPEPESGVSELFIYSRQDRAVPLVLYGDVKSELFGEYSQNNAITLSSRNANAVLAFDSTALAYRLGLLERGSIIRLFCTFETVFTYPNTFIERYYELC